MFTPSFRDFKDGGVWLWRTYQQRRIAPQKAHQQVLEDQAHWYDERAEKLVVFRFQLGQEPTPDRFRLALLVSKLDQHDRNWAMKLTDIEVLRKAAGEKAAECRENAGDCRRAAQEVAYKIFW
jgi:hypothetical protein